MSDSSLLELLSVTDKAVKALNKSQSSHSSQGSHVSASSQRSLTKDSGIKTQTENIQASKATLESGDLSDVSTTASDVLIRSTIVENDEQQHSPGSNDSTRGAKVGSHSSGSVDGAKFSSSESKCSRTSIGVENFNSSGPQKVKISSKKLREIRSPLGSDSISPRSDGVSPPLVTQKNVNNKKSQVLHEKPIVTRHFSSDGSDSKLQKKQSSQGSVLPSNLPPVSVQNQSQSNADRKLSEDKYKGIKGTTTPNDKDVSSECGDKRDSPENRNEENSVPCSEKGSNDSHDVIVERHGPKITHPTKERFNKDDEETERIRRKLLELEDDVDMIPQKETVPLSEASVNTSCTDSDKVSIVTIPERIVTVSARTSFSTDISYGEEEGERIPPKLVSAVQAPHKYSSHHLRQGAPVEGTDVRDQQKQTVDVQISQFMSSDRQKIKESLAKRQENAGPIKRVVQPKLVNPTVTEQKKKPESKTEQADTVTATVAASVAVAATAPFLKAQQELENRMKDMLAKIADLQTQKVSPVNDDRVKELERQVAALTEQRIQHLERLQEHQVEMQAKLLSMTRSAPKRRSGSPETPMHTPLTHRRPGVSNFGPNAKKAAFTKTTVSRPKSTSPVRVGGSPTRSEHSRICESPYDTPNPRSRAPKPVAYNNSAIETKETNQRTRGILEEILASSESPRPRLPSPEPQVPRAAYDHDLAKSPVIRKAERLVHDLSGINDDVKSVVSEIDRCKHLEEKKRQVELKRDELLGPAPLDAYLVKSSSKDFTTPYKSVPDLAAHRYNAPVPPGFSEAEQVLQDVTKTRAYLEANLQTVLRAQHETEVYATLESLYQNSTDPERAVLQQKVDKWVSKLRLQVEREITDDMVIAEMQKSHLPIYKVPPPPTITAPAQPPKGRGRGGVLKSEVGVAKPRPGARIDTGLGKRLAGKENKPELPRPTVKKTRAPYEDEEYMTKVYGKASYQGKRTTMKDPYIHLRNEPKQKPDRPPGVDGSTKGHFVKSAKSQTTAGIKQFYFSPTHGTYIPISTGASSGPIKGSLVPMAVPLGGPRMDGGLTVPVTMTTDGLVTSTPVAKTQVTAGRNVALISVPAQDSLIGEKPTPELSKQVLPNVDIDTDISEVSEKLQSKKSALVSARSEKSKSEKSKSKRSKSPPKSQEKTKEIQPSKQKEDSSKRSVVLPPPEPSPSKVLDATFAPALQDEEADNTEVSELYDDDFDPESAPGMQLPGYRPPSPPEYREPGPSFPPKVPGHDRIMAASDVIAEDIRRKELLQNKAVEWVEQEMMARVISQMATQRRVAPPQMGHEVEEVEDSISSDHENSMFLMEALGHTGLKLFIDAGLPVDTSLVNSLVKECLLEKVVTMLGQRPDDVGTGMTQARHESKMAAAAAGGSKEQEEAGYVREDDFGRRQVKTPQPTPKSSPVMSPVRVTSPPYTPPASPPFEQEVPAYRQPVVVQPEYESEISESIDISEEIRNLQGKLVRSDEPVTGREIHTVETPVPTPVPEEEIKEETRPATPPPPTPRQEVVVPKVQPQVVEVPKEVPQEPEVVVPSPIKPVDQATSPEPWGNPDSPIPEENPDYQEEGLDHPSPIVLTAAPGDDEMISHPISPIPAVRVPSPIKPGTPERPHSPAHSDDTTTIESSISDTLNQSVSMGQWLLSKSDGEVADYILDDDLRQRIAKSTKHKGDQSVGDTLRDTTDLMDESVDPVSEGEFQHKVNLSPEKDPVLNFIASLQKSPQVKQGQYDIPSNQVYDILNQTGKSMGEITMVRQSGDYRFKDQGYGYYGNERYGYQQDRGPVDGGYFRNQEYPGRQYTPAERDRRMQERDRHSPDQRRQNRSPEYRDRDRRSPEYRDRRSPEYRDRRSPEYRDMRSPEYRERDRRSPEYRERDRRSPEYRERDRRSPDSRDRGMRSPSQREARSPTQRGRTSPQRSSGEDRRTKSPQQRQSQEMYYSNGFSPQGTRQSFNSETQDSFRRSSVEFNDVPQIMSGSGKQRGRKQPSGGITVTPGGLMTGGRSPLKSAMRKPPQVQKSGGQPDRSVSKSQHQVLQVRSSDQEVKDSLEGSQNLYGFNSTDQRSSRAYTPDQMNLDALVQSGYLTQSLTYSAELHQSGNLSQSMDRNSFRDSLENRQMSPTRTKRGQSLGLTYSFDDEDDYKGTGDLEGTGTLKMSVTLPTIEGSNSELSEIDITDRR